MRRVLVLLLMLCSPAWAGNSSFDGSTSRVVIGAHAHITTSVFSVGCWTYRAGAGEGSAGAILTQADETGTTGFQLRVSGTNYRMIEWWTTGYREDDAAAPSANTWVHVAMTYDGTSTSNVPILYYDGVSQGLTNNNNTISGSFTTANQMVWGDNDAATKSWNGLLSECWRSNRVLTADEIKQVRRCGPASMPPPPGRRGYWPMGLIHGLNVSRSGTLIDGTETSITLSNTGPPISYPQGASCYADR
jgi:Concanavalin A-like lectin/glucanases superfamily